MIFSFWFYAADYEMEKELTVKENTIYPNSIISIGGNIYVKGSVKESIIMIGGSLKLDGEVKQDVICIATDIKLKKNAWIKGELLVFGGELDRHPESKVTGEFFYFRFDLKKIENTLIPIISDAQTITFLKILKIIFWLILTLVVLAIVPQKVTQADEIFDKNILKIGLTGLISLFIFIFLLILLIIMSFLIIGIPFLFLLILAYFVILIFGRTVIFYYIGRKISHSLRLKNITPGIYLLFGVIFYTLLKFLPLLGVVLLMIMNIFEIGIGVGFFLRKKIRLKS
jgi:hypothetical protein